MTYTLSYARVVILERTIEVPDDSLYPELWVREEAAKLEGGSKLGIASVKAKHGSEVVEIEDYDVIWEITED